MPDKPNFLLILTDQHALKAMGCYGGLAEIPNLDAPGRERLPFPDGHTANSNLPAFPLLATT